MNDNEQYEHIDEMPVDVSAAFHKENRVEPLSFWLDDTEYIISRVLEEIRGGALKRRGAGIRYKIRVQDNRIKRESYLFRIGDLWYLAEHTDSVPDIQTRHRGFNHSGKKIIDGRYDNRYKVAVDVAAMCGRSGVLNPYSFRWEDGTEYQIDRIVGQERAASLKAGIIGIRYIVRVMGKEIYMFRDDDLWWMERKGKCRVLDVHGQPVD